MGIDAIRKSASDLFGRYDQNNVFALILKGERPCFRLFEDDVALAFLDTFPQAAGHTLIIPKTIQSRNFLDFPTQELGAFMERVQFVALAIATTLQPEGIQIQQFNGSASGQTIFHLHFHIIPRTNGTKLIPHGEAPRAHDADLEAMASRIRVGFE